MIRRDVGERVVEVKIGITEEVDIVEVRAEVEAEAENVVVNVAKENIEIEVARKKGEKGVRTIIVEEP